MKRPCIYPNKRILLSNLVRYHNKILRSTGLAPDYHEMVGYACVSLNHPDTSLLDVSKRLENTVNECVLKVMEASLG